MEPNGGRMQYCNDCFATMDDDALHCKGCQSRDVRAFESTAGEKSNLDNSRNQSGDRLDSNKLKLDPQFTVIPKAAPSEEPSNVLYFHPDDAHRKKVENERRAAKEYKQRVAQVNIRASDYLDRYDKRRKLSKVFRFLVVPVILGSVAFAVVPDLWRGIESAWKEANTAPERPLSQVEVETKGSFAWLSGTAEPTELWDPCRTIYWAVNPKNEPPSARKMLANAFLEVSAATGLKFEYLQETNEEFNANRSPVNSKYTKHDSDWNPVLITYLKGTKFAKALVESGNGDSPDAVAFAGPEGAFDSDGNSVYVSGEITISSDWFTESMRDWGRAQTKATFLHEIGHLVGLHHVDDSSELMHAKNTGQTGFAPGDRQGLALAGQAKCLTRAQYPIPRWTNWSEFD